MNSGSCVLRCPGSCWHGHANGAKRGSWVPADRELSCANGLHAAASAAMLNRDARTLRVGFMMGFQSLVVGGELGVADRREDEQLAVLGHRYSPDGQRVEIRIPFALLGWEDGVSMLGVDR